MARIIPVIDVMNGQVVHAVGGQRHKYKPIRSTIVDSTDPLAVARAMLNATGSSEIYVADLDAIRGDGTLSDAVVRLIDEVNATVWLDHGVRTGGESERLAVRSNVNIVVGSETCQGPSALDKLLSILPAARIAFSIDMKDSVILGDTSIWGPMILPDLMKRVARHGIRQFIIIDLADVGNDAGSRIRLNTIDTNHSRVMIGGGIRTPEDVKSLEQYGVDAVLVATAIHLGILPDASATRR